LANFGNNLDFHENKYKDCYLLCVLPCRRAVRKVSDHFEYLENQPRGLEVTWQPFIGYLTVHPWSVNLPWD